MPIDAICSYCSAPYRLADNMLGKQVRCKGCQKAFTVTPAPAVEAQMVEAEPADEAPPPRRSGVLAGAARPRPTGDSGSYRPARAPAPTAAAAAKRKARWC